MAGRWRCVRRGAAALVALAGLAAGLPGGGAGAASGGALPPPLTLVVGFGGVDEVPDDAVGVALNVTVTGPLAPGYLTVFPCGAPPLASNLNFVPGQTLPNFVIAALDADGDVCIRTSGTTDVVVDLAGYVPAGSDLTMLPEPRRFLDTRDGTGAPKARVRAGEVLAVQVAGTHGVPAGATSVVFNATAVSPSAPGFLTVFPCGALPPTSTLNYTAGAIVPNLVVTALDPAGRVCFYAMTDTDVVADVAAFRTGGGGWSMLSQPLRVVDTRIGLGGPAQPVHAQRLVALGALASPPDDATAAIVNLTATNGSAPGYLTASPCPVGIGATSNLNFLAGQNVGNLAIVRLDTTGSICVASNTAVDVVVDVLGWVNGSASYVPLTPVRVYDSRDDARLRCNLAITSTGGGGLRWFDLATNTPGPTFHPSAGPWYWTSNSAGLSLLTITPDCSSALVGLHPGRLIEVARSGAVLGEVQLATGMRPFVTRFGIYAAGEVEPGVFAIIDPFSGEQLLVLAELAARGPTWNLLGAAEDGSLLVFWRWTAHNEPQIHVLAGDGRHLSTFTLPQGTEYIRLSPNADYLSASGQEPVPGGTRRSHTRVFTLDGTLVATRAGGDLRSWATDGVSYSCSGNATAEWAVRWELFSPATDLLGTPCLQAVR